MKDPWQQVILDNRQNLTHPDHTYLCSPSSTYTLHMYYTYMYWLCIAFSVSVIYHCMLGTKGWDISCIREMYKKEISDLTDKYDIRHYPSHESTVWDIKACSIRYDKIYIRWELYSNSIRAYWEYLKVHCKYIIRSYNKDGRLQDLASDQISYFKSCQ